MADIYDRPTLMQEFKLRAGNAGLNVLVPSFGPFEADTAIIGEGAGETEIRMSMPFVGGAGQLLWNTARPYGLAKHEVYTTNVVKRQISLGKDTNERFQVSKGEFEAWAGLLRWELSNLPNLRYIVLLGNYALKAVLGLDGITNWRGSVLDATIGMRTVRCICAFNPAYVMREPKFEPIMPLDFAKVRMVREGKFKEHNVNAIVCRSVDEAISHLDRFHREAKPVAYDIETINQQTACYGFSNDKHEGVCIPLREPNENLYSPSDEAPASVGNTEVIR